MIRSIPAAFRKRRARCGRGLPPGTAAAVALALALGAALPGWAGPATPPNGSDTPEAVAARLRARVESLTAPALAGRAAGSPGAAAAAETLASWFAAAGLEPAFAGAWRQPFALSGEGWTGDPLQGRQGTNVAAGFAGSGGLAGRWVVVGAHLDHLGEVAPGSSGGRAPEPGAYYPGANDNASGVAIVHELAGRLRAAAPPGADPDARRSVLLVNFDGEEVGLQGSAWFVQHSPVPLDSIDVMVNLDTVGALADGRLIVSGLGTAAPLEPAVAGAAQATGVEVNPSRGGWSGSDHMVFNTREVPVLFLFGGPYPEYNRPADAAATLDYRAMARVAAFTTHLVERLRTVPGPFDWVMVAAGGLRDDGEPAPAGAAGEGVAGAGNRQTWLGTMPDFSEGQPGYRLAGVFDGSPAAAAGLEKGDVLVRFGDYPVTDLATFTTALRAYAPGDLVEVGIEREGRPLRFTVALGDRSQRR